MSEPTRLANMALKDAMRTPKTTGRPAGVEKWITHEYKGRDPWTIEIDWTHRVVRVSSQFEDIYTPLDNVRDYQLLPKAEPAPAAPNVASGPFLPAKSAK